MNVLEFINEMKAYTNENDEEWSIFHWEPQDFEEKISKKLSQKIEMEEIHDDNPGDGREGQLVIKVKPFNFLIAIWYTYSSHGESCYEDEPYEVEAKEVMVTQYLKPETEG